MEFEINEKVNTSSFILLVDKKGMCEAHSESVLLLLFPDFCSLIFVLLCFYSVY